MPTELITLDQFYTKYNIHLPITNYLGQYPGECVSLISRYLADCYGLTPGAWGNATDYYPNPNPAILTVFDVMLPGTTPQDGDILVWGDDPGTFTGADGHIAIAYRGRIMNQNYEGKKYLTLDNFFSPGYKGLLRPKGDDMIQDTDDWFTRANRLHRQELGAELPRERMKEFVGMTWIHFTDLLSNNPAADVNTAMADLGRVVTDQRWLQNILDLRSDITNLQDTSQVAKIRAKVKELDDLVR